MLLDKYFSYFLYRDDLEKDMLKPSPKGVFEILKHCPYKNIKYLGVNVEDIIASNLAQVESIGVVGFGDNYNMIVNNFRHLGVKYILDDMKNLQSFLLEIKNSPRS